MIGVVGLKKSIIVDALSYKTISAKKGSIENKWVVIDATNQILGRLASRIAARLRGKHRPDFTPHVDCGDNVIVINVEKVQLSGNKWQDKVYIRHTGYPGGQRKLKVKELLDKNPKEILFKAVKGMLPKNRLSREIIKKMKLFVGDKHEHNAQNPYLLTIDDI